MTTAISMCDSSYRVRSTRRRLTRSITYFGDIYIVGCVVGTDGMMKWSQNIRVEMILIEMSKYKRNSCAGRYLCLLNGSNPIKRIRMIHVIPN
jgi:hypothetical protein